MKREFTRRAVLAGAASTALAPALVRAAGPGIFDRESYRHYVDDFNAYPTEGVESFIPDTQAWAWMKDNVPFFACPDPELERTWYYRWWSLRKHIRQTPGGFIFTEFIRPVRHATDHNAISCALGHHILEGRWLRDPRYLDQYVRFWLHGGEDGGLQRHYHQYSGWTAAALYHRWLADGRMDEMVSLLDALVADYRQWERDRLLPSGLFWQYDVRDGMEESVSGSRRQKNARPTINSYMYGNAAALAKIGRLAGKADLSREFEGKAARLKTLVQEKLWDREAAFFKPLLEAGGLADVREEIGYTPWYFNLPDDDREYAQAWKQLMDPRGFHAAYGPTTAEQRHPGFRIANSGDDCQWNGPSWPFSTTVTLRGLANLLQGYRQTAVSRQDYFDTLLTYARSQRLKLPDGRRIAWVDENLNPFTGEWHARARKIAKGTFNGRGDHYNHSGFCDLVITGLVGLRPRPDHVVEVSPLLPEGAWDWFCLDGVRYHGRTLTILWDRKGHKFGKGEGLRVFAGGGKLIARTRRLVTVKGQLPASA